MKLLAFAFLVAQALFGQGIPLGFAHTFGSGGGSSFTLINTAPGDNGSSSVATIATTTFALTAGNLVVVPIRMGGIVTVTGVTDSAGNTYSQVPSAYCCSSGNATDLWYSKTTTGYASNVVTVTLSGAVQYAAVVARQYSGASASPLDTPAGPGVICTSCGMTSVTTITSNSFTPSGSGHLIVCIGSQGVGGGTWTAGSGFANLVNSGGAADVSTEDIVNSTASAQTASLAYSASSGMLISCGVFK